MITLGTRGGLALAVSPREALEAERTRLLAQAIGDHALPYEVALRVEALTEQLDDAYS